ncbi:MAG TPA: TonB-dependent receptor [Methylibium sp.]|uniref:TonB-dependent receptor n=1 Tax=Methylibium sp. TaxID=2067992 RepID=UPI002DBE1577|nr:TonB-dependent receptor [Methylibium sp.]HEU4458856.1 TonB-dependent receptor [Methylibium sp.]
MRHPDRYEPTRRPRPGLLALAAWLAAGGAMAQGTPAPAADAGTALVPVVVRGQAAAADRALDDQELASDIRSVVRSDGIGRLPDKNAAEALQRLPGVSIERDQGEGRYVRVRGLGPDLNAVTIHGSLVPSPERDRRAVMLDVLPSSLIGSLEVIKTLTPEMDANSLGGTIEVKSLSAFDLKARLLSVELGASNNRQTDRSSPYGSLVFADRFLDGRLGVALGLNAERRRFGSKNVETGGAWDADALESFERRDYRITRDRVGGALNLELRPAQGSAYTLRAMSSRFTDDERRLAHGIAFAAAQPAGALGDAESTRELKDRKETQRIESLVLGTEQRFGDWSANAAFGVSRSSEHTPPHIAGASFDGGDFADVGFENTRTPRLVGPAAINDAAGYELDEIELERMLVKDRERNLRFDLARRLAAFGAPAEVKFGAKASRRTKTSAQTTWILQDFGDPPFSLPDAQRGLGAYAGPSPDYPLGAFGPGIEAAPLRALVGGIDLDPFVDDEESTINNFRMKEDIDAAYLQGKFELAGWKAITGLRYEGTRFKAKGSGLLDGEFVPTTTDRKDRHWLPGLHLRRDLDDDTAVRAAFSKSVVRPTFGQLAPGFAIEGDEAAFGNPELRPLRSTNLDLGIERRLGFAGVISAYGFHKRIRDFVYPTDLAGTPGRWEGFDEAISFANGDKAKVYGVELAWSQSLKGVLPGAWGALLLGANATFSKSDARIERFDGGAAVSRSIPLPSQSDRIVNLMLGYENDAFSLRLAANHKSRYLLEVSDVLDAGRDLYVDAQTQLDLSARWSPSKAWQLSFELLNLNDAPYSVYAGQRARNAQWETYGRTVRLSLKYTLD